MKIHCLFRLFKVSIFTSSLLTISISSYSQSTTYHFDSVSVNIEGTSTLHGWIVEAQDIAGFPEELQINSTSVGVIEDFGFEVKVASMDGGRGASMNTKIYNALNSESHPNVVYQQIGPASYQDGKLVSRGMLQMAGVSKDIEVEAVITIDDDAIVISSHHAMKLSDFNIEPPSAMFGQIKTKDDIVIHFHFVYQQS